ncbi:hypothetical protein P1X14_18165 [Sphingomonas sp. AOB5]|uniref:hypothetical protein n=1 Tax=Sphingomonas sp. AOB5 TaxID=3034017 RepID=UPI0023F70018|nr:hypothetical protein [Sphingomonas sp. AOB5]MDF7777190.1 hypothetical protein [Sphingomonas sp. AOB5]
MKLSLKRRHIRRRADLPPVPYHRWIRPLATFCISLSVFVVLPAIYFRGAQWTSLAAALILAALSTLALELIIKHRANRQKSLKKRRKRTA